MYQNGTLDYWENDAPINIQKKKWTIDNWDVGKSRKQKKDKKVKDLDDQLKKDLDE